MSGSAIDPHVIASLVATGRAMKRTLFEAERDGKIKAEDVEGVAVQSLLRAVDRIAALPDERALTDDEVIVFGSSLIQVATAAVVLLDLLPLPSMSVMVAGFEMEKRN